MRAPIVTFRKIFSKASRRYSERIGKCGCRFQSAGCDAWRDAKHSREVTGDIVDVDLAHAPVVRPAATPLHARMQRAGRIVKNAQAIRRRENLRTHRAEQ